jgi:adenylate cyclase
MEQPVDPIERGTKPLRVPPSATDVQAQLDRMLTSSAFQASTRRRAMLRYVVEETLAGRGDRLKGFSVAVAVFGRGETFDSQSDPVVRFEARRLRRDLDSYYIDAGSGDPLRITIPKGGYVPHFEWQRHASPADDRQSAALPEAAPAEPPPPSSASTLAAAVVGKPSRGYIGGTRAWAALLAIALCALAAFGAWLWFDRAPPVAEARGPSLIVLPFEPLGSSDDVRYLAAGISEKLVDALRRFPGFRLYASPASADVEMHSPVALGQNLGIAYVVAGTVSMGAEGPSHVDVARREHDTRRRA